jgi:hypothetical protein
VVLLPSYRKDQNNPPAIDVEFLIHLACKNVSVIGVEENAWRKMIQNSLPIDYTMALSIEGFFSQNSFS